MEYMWKKTTIFNGLLVMLGWLFLVLLNRFGLFNFSANFSLFLTLAFQIVMLAFVYFSLFREVPFSGTEDQSFFKKIGLVKFQYRYLVVGFGMLLGFFAINFVYNATVFLLFPDLPTQADYLLDYLAKSDYPSSLYILGVFTAPVIEEIFFRGFFFKALSQYIGPLKGALLSSLIFTVLHGVIRAFFPIFILGVMLCFLYRESKSLVPGIIVHFVVNGLGSIALFYLSNMETINRIMQ